MVMLESGIECGDEVGMASMIRKSTHFEVFSDFGKKISLGVRIVITVMHVVENGSLNLIHKYILRKLYEEKEKIVCTHT